MKRQSHGSLSSKVFDLLSLKKLLELDAGPCADNPSKKSKSTQQNLSIEARKEIYAICENFDEKTLCEMQFLKEQVEHIWKSCKDIYDKHKNLNPICTILRRLNENEMNPENQFKKMGRHHKIDRNLLEKTILEAEKKNALTAQQISDMSISLFGKRLAIST
ncbi:hypothetical protein QTN25_002446 [Entamoeba marina]